MKKLGPWKLVGEMERFKEPQAETMGSNKEVDQQKAQNLQPSSVIHDSVKASAFSLLQLIP